MKTVGQRLREVGLDEKQAEQAVRVFLQYLPSPVDVKAKWEAEDGGIYVHFSGDKKHDDLMLRHATGFSEDQGWNHYHFELRNRLAGIPGSIDKSFRIGDHKDTH